MTDEELRALLDNEIRGAIGYDSSELANQRKTALEYYYGEPFGNEVEGRSSYVSRDVADTIEWIMPSLMRIFTGGDTIVRFEPQGPEDEQAASQATDYVNYIFQRQNDGFLTLYTWFKDALLSKNGFVKVYYEKYTEYKTETYENLSDDEFAQILSDEKVEPIEHTEDAVVDESGVTMRTHSVKLRRNAEKGKCCVIPIPPEEVLVNKNPISPFQKNRFRCHRRKVTIQELKDMGFENVDDIQSDEEDFNEERTTRFSFDQTDSTTDDRDPLSREVWLSECYRKIDVDGDGIAEERTVIMAGNRILENAEGYSSQLISITPIILPHKLYGMSIADLVMDLQLLKSTIFRQILDNMYLANNGRYMALDGMVNIDDLLTSRPGGIIRVKTFDAVKPIQPPLLGAPAFNLLEYIDVIKENRTGVTRYNQGIDSDSLNKMLDIFTPIPLADGGSKVLAEIADGDLIVGSDGRPTTVIKAHEIQDPKRAYRLTFASGEEIVAGGEHLWTVFLEHDRVSVREAGRRVIDTDAIYDRMSSGETLYVPRVQRPQTGGGQKLPVDPYLLGCWLGDGTSKKSAITTMDPEIVDAFRADGWVMYADKTQNSGRATTWCIGAAEAVTVRDGTTGRMVATGASWLNKVAALAGNKHIPDIYLRASYEDRLALLRGLMDTDGCAHSGALAIFSQKSGRLLSDTVRLIESLGGWPTLNEVNPGAGGREGETYWNVTFHLFDNPFRLPRKAAKWSPPQRNVTTQAIRSIEPVPIRPMRCLTVDAPDGLFCVGRRFTVTHNTATGINQIMSAAQARVELIARVFAETGVKDLFYAILEAVQKHQDKPTVVRLRNQWVQMDPREWANRFDMSVTVGLGTGSKDMQIAALLETLKLQFTALQGGLPIVTPANVYNTAQKLLEAQNIKGGEMFFTHPDQMPPSPPQADPGMVEMAIAEKEIQADIAKTQMKVQAGTQSKVMQQQGKMAMHQQDTAVKDQQHQREVMAEMLQHEKEIQRGVGRGAKPGGTGETAPF